MVVRWFYVTPMRQGPGSMCWLWYKGYLVILAGLVSEAPGRVAQAWNLGPHDAKQYSVRDVLELMSSNWTRPTLEYMDNPLPEAQALALDSSLARNQLGWLPAWIRSRLCRKLLRGIAATTQIPLPHEQFLWRSSTRGARRCDDDLCNRSSRTIGAAIMREYVGQDVRILNRSDYQAWSRPAMEGCISRYFDTGSGCLDATIFVASGLLNPALSHEELLGVNYYLPKIS